MEAGVLLLAWGQINIKQRDTEGSRYAIDFTQDKGFLRRNRARFVEDITYLDLLAIINELPGKG